MSQCVLGQEYQVSALLGGKDVVEYLLSLGLFPGAWFRLVGKGKRYFVLAIKDGRYAIDLSLAEQILLQKTEVEVAECDCD